MTASINGRALTDGEFVCVINGMTYVGRAQEWNYTQQADHQLPRCTLNGVITDQQRNESAEPVAAELTYEHLIVTYVSYEDLPVEGAHDRLYLIFQDNVLLPCAYVYRPSRNRVFEDAYCTLPYKPTNLSAAQVRAAYPDGSLLARWHTADNTSHVCHRVAGDNPTWSTGLLLSNERVFADPALRCEITGETLAAPVRPTAAPAARRRLTVQIIPWNALPLVGDRDTLYIVNDPLAGGGETLGVVDEAAYVYRPDDRDGPDPAPYKATNVSAAVVARLHDSGDQIPSQSDIARARMAFSVRYVIAERPNEQLEVRTRDDFLAWMPIQWRLNEIPVRSRPGHVFVPEVRNERPLWAIDEIDEVTRRELLLGSARQELASAFSGLVVTYVSSLDELPVRGEEHRLYCIYGYEAAYVYRRGRTPPYRPTNLSAAALAENYADGATLERAPPALALVVISFSDDSHVWLPVRPRDEQGQYCCSWRILLPAGVRTEPLEGRRPNTVDHVYTLPPGTAFPTQAVQGDLVTVPIPRLTVEQMNRDVWSRMLVRPADHIETQLSVALPPAPLPPPPPHTVPGHRRLILD